MIDEKKLIEEIRNAINDGRFDEYKPAAVLYGVYDMITDMPKVGEWIPCSERLPEEARAIEVTMYDGNRAIGHFYKSMETWFDSINGGAIDVIAWKEPSKPWKGENE